MTKSSIDFGSGLAGFISLAQQAILDDAGVVKVLRQQIGIGNNRTAYNSIEGVAARLVSQMPVVPVWVRGTTGAVGSIPVPSSAM